MYLAWTTDSFEGRTVSSLLAKGVWRWLYLPPPPLRIYTGGGGGIILESLCCLSVYPSVRVSICPCVRSCPLNISWTTQPFFTKLGIVVYYHEAMCHEENVKVTERAYIIKIWLLLLWLLNCWSVCNQTWFDSTTLEARVLCGKIGLLRSTDMNRGMCSCKPLSFCVMVAY